ncbi:MAG: hypothetical protein PHV05_05795 [Candidatus Riflebacteria bacterium]|nr:hypothetical protein [Candidatus Riflebacteria bacterium]
MWIVILNFCLFILLLGFFFHGIRQWSGLIVDYEDSEEPDQNVTDGKYNRLPIWIFIIGAGLYSLAGSLLNWIGF